MILTMRTLTVGPGQLAPTARDFRRPARMGLIAFFCLCVSTGRSTSSAHEGEHETHLPPKVPDEVAHRPTAIPDRIVLSWTGEPHSTQSVTWRTDTTVSKAFAEIALTEDGPKFPDKADRIDATTESLATDLGSAHYHSATFQDLAPKTKYVYRVGDGTNWSEWSHFRTAAREPEPFTFVYFGDAQNDIKSHWSRVVREAYSDAPRAAFMLHAGDLINRANRDAEWGEWFYASSFIHRTIPCVATPGNHEYEKIENEAGETVSRHLSRHWRPTFAFPENGPAGLEESVYVMDYQGTRIVSLNSNEQHEKQVPWLREVLSKNPRKWTILAFHHPIYSSKEGRDNPELRAAWQPVFDQFQVDLVLQGHDHTYARSRLMTYQNVAAGVRRRNNNKGTMYVVSVSGPKMYELGQRPFMRSSAENTQLYQVITVDGDELRYVAHTATGRVYDSFALRKRRGRPNRLVEGGTDEVRRRRGVRSRR